MRYLITDPCYVIPDDEWMTFLNRTEFGEDMKGFEYAKGVGNIVEVSPTTYGDGSIHVGRQQIGVDAGLVCIVELDDEYQHEPNEWGITLGAVTDDYDEAQDWFARAKQI